MYNIPTVRSPLVLCCHADPALDDGNLIRFPDVDEQRFTLAKQLLAQGVREESTGASADRHHSPSVPSPYRPCPRLRPPPPRECWTQSDTCGTVWSPLGSSLICDNHHFHSYSAMSLLLPFSCSVAILRRKECVLSRCNTFPCSNRHCKMYAITHLPHHSASIIVITCNESCASEVVLVCAAVLISLAECRSACWGQSVQPWEPAEPSSACYTHSHAKDSLTCEGLTHMRRTYFEFCYFGLFGRVLSYQVLGTCL